MQPSALIKVAVILLLAVTTLVLYPVPNQVRVMPLGQMGYESLSIAESLATGKGFADPFREIETGPSAHLAPAFPAFLAMIIKNTSSDESAMIWMVRFSTLMVLLQVCLLPILARYLEIGFYTGVGASVLWLIALVPREYFWEQNYSGVLITLMAFLMVMAMKRQLTTPWLIACALLWGVLLLLCPVALLALVAWLVVLYFWRTQKTKTLVVLAVVPLLMIAPWMVRNYNAFHRVVFVRDNLGIEMAVSNNSCASFSFVVNELTNCYAQFHPNENLDEIHKVGDLGEVAYNQTQMQFAKTWIKENQGAFVGLTVKRFVAFWVPMFLSEELSVIHNKNFYSPLRDVIVSIASILGVLGAVLLWMKNRSVCVVILIWLVTFPIIYYLTQYNERARIPVEWAILLLGCYAVSEVVQKLMQGRVARS